MQLNNLNKTVILIDVDFLSERIIDNYLFYRKRYPCRNIPDISFAELVYNIALNGRVNEKGNRVDVILFYNPVHSILPFTNIPNNVDSFIDTPSKNHVIKSDCGDLYLRSYFYDAEDTFETNVQDKEQFDFEYMFQFRDLLNQIYNANSISKIIIVADNKLLNKDIDSYCKNGDKRFILERDNANDSQYWLDDKYIGTYYFVDVNYPIAYAMGLSNEVI